MQNDNALNQSIVNSHNKDTIRINITMHRQLLQITDEAAKNDFTSRSDIIRIALLWYLRPLGRDLNQADPEAILKVIKQRKLKADINRSLSAE